MIKRSISIQERFWFRDLKKGGGEGGGVSIRLHSAQSCVPQPLVGQARSPQLDMWTPNIANANSTNSEGMVCAELACPVKGTVDDGDDDDDDGGVEDALAFPEVPAGGGQSVALVSMANSCAPTRVVPLMGPPAPPAVETYRMCASDVVRPNRTALGSATSLELRLPAMIRCMELPVNCTEAMEFPRLWHAKAVSPAVGLKAKSSHPTPLDASMLVATTMAVAVGGVGVPLFGSTEIFAMVPLAVLVK